MFSTLNNILGTQTRHAEETDTRQALQRHDPDNPRGGRKKKQKEDEPGFEDGVAATLSVEALKAFLKTLLESKTPQAQSANIQEPTDYKIQTEMELDKNPTKHVSAHAAQAAGAYQSATSHAQKRENVLLETTDTAVSGPEFDLSATDIRTIHQLQEDLNTLSNHNIEYIHIERAETFLQSLQNAVKAAKVKIH